MNRKFIINARHLPIWLSIVTGLLVAFLVWNHIYSVQSHAITQITDLSARSEDGAIVLQWTPLTDCRDKQIEIKIGKDEEYYSVEIPASHHSYTYTEGDHGKRYEFSVAVKGEQAPQTQTAMFLNFAQLPNLPLVTVETVTGKDPTCDISVAPAGCWGATTVNNDCLAMSVSVQKDDLTTIKANGTIEIRGNTSAFSDQKPYKLTLNQPMDMLSGQSSEKKDTEWLLIRYNPLFKTELGHYIATLCGSEWQSAYCPVNVMLNGDWKGCYLLVESVKNTAGRVHIDHSGFLIECDAYWWSKGDLYFKTPYQAQPMGYTFKYPKVSNMKAPRAVAIQQYVTDYEKALMEGQGDYTAFIDVQSFASWLLTHDILMNTDGAGSNIYLYKKDMTSASKMKLGPAWDFDAIMPDENEDWSVIHWIWIMHFDVLLQKEEFRDAYLKRWDLVSDVLCDGVSEFLNEYTQQQGEALQESWDLDSERWQTELTNIQESVDYVNGWFAERKAWLDIAMQEI